MEALFDKDAMRKRIEIHMNEATSADLRAKFAYIFESPAGSSYPPILRERRLVAGTACVISGPGGTIEATPFELEHGDISALGFRIGALAYTPDLNGVPDASLPFLERERKVLFVGVLASGIQSGLRIAHHRAQPAQRRAPPGQSAL